jgi:hypothetical protein
MTLQIEIESLAQNRAAEIKTRAKLRLSNQGDIVLERQENYG